MTRAGAPRRTAGGAGAGASGRPRSVQGIVDALGAIIASAEPAVVLSSLARSSNPSFSDACAIELSEGTETLFRVCFPALDDAELPAYDGPVGAAGGARPGDVRSVITAFEAGPSHGYPAYAGIAVHFWAERDPTEDDAIIARMLVDRALSLVEKERLAQAAARADSRAARLAIDVITSSIEGEATGILMAKHHITRAQAGILLRQASQERQRKLHEVAAGVVRRGDLDSLLPRDPAGSVRPVNLHVASWPGHPSDRAG